MKTFTSFIPPAKTLIRPFSHAMEALLNSQALFNQASQNYDELRKDEQAAFEGLSRGKKPKNSIPNLSDTNFQQIAEIIKTTGNITELEKILFAKVAGHSFCIGHHIINDNHAAIANRQTLLPENQQKPGFVSFSAGFDKHAFNNNIDLVLQTPLVEQKGYSAPYAEIPVDTSIVPDRSHRIDYENGITETGTGSTLVFTNRQTGETREYEVGERRWFGPYIPYGFAAEAVLRLRAFERLTYIPCYLPLQEIIGPALQEMQIHLPGEVAIDRHVVQKSAAFREAYSHLSNAHGNPDLRQSTLSHWEERSRQNRAYSGGRNFD